MAAGPEADAPVGALDTSRKQCGCGGGPDGDSEDNLWPLLTGNSETLGVADDEVDLAADE